MLGHTKKLECGLRLPVWLASQPSLLRNALHWMPVAMFRQMTKRAKSVLKGLVEYILSNAFKKGRLVRLGPGLSIRVPLVASDPAYIETDPEYGSVQPISIESADLLIRRLAEVVATDGASFEFALGDTRVSAMTKGNYVSVKLLRGFFGERMLFERRVLIEGITSYWSIRQLPFEPDSKAKCE